MLAHVPSFGRNPRDSPDFLAYPVPEACMHVLGTGVPRCLGVARSASSPKAAQGLGCSLTPGLWISFGRVTCMARAASVPGLWGLAFLLLCGVCLLGPGCGWVWVLLTLPVLAGVLGGCVWARFVVLSLFCRLFVVLLVGLRFRPAYGTCVFSCAPCLPPPFSGSGVRCGRACWARVSAVPHLSRLGCRGVFFVFLFVLALWCRFLGVPVLGLVFPVPHPLSFELGCSLCLCFFVVCVCMFRCPFSRWAAVPGLVLPVLAGWSPCASLGVLSSVPSGWGVWPPLVVFAGGFVAVGCFRTPPPPPLFFLRGGGACLFLPLPSLGWRTHWPAFSVVLRAAVGGCVLFGRVPAPWVTWVMYTFGSAPLPAGLGPGSAGWAAAPGGCVWLWVRGLELFVSFLLCGASFNLLGGPPPLLPGARWLRVWPAVPVSGVLVRRLPGCAVACLG